MKRNRIVVACTLVLSIAVLFSGASAFADQYGQAGCGLGSMLLGAEPGFKQVFAATTNGTSGNQTFAISTGTSNCKPEGSASAAIPAFIDANKVALADDIARGNGETVASLSNLMGCTDNSLLNSTLQKNYTTIFPTEGVSTDAVSQSIISVVKSHSALAGTCTL